MQENKTLIIKTGNPNIKLEEYHKLETFSDMCKIVNKDNIDNFLKDFEQILRTITIGTENVNKDELNFGPMLWMED